MIPDSDGGDRTKPDMAQFEKITGSYCTGCRKKTDGSKSS